MLVRIPDDGKTKTSLPNIVKAAAAVYLTVIIQEYIMTNRWRVIPHQAIKIPRLFARAIRSLFGLGRGGSKQSVSRSGLPALVCKSISMSKLKEQVDEGQLQLPEEFRDPITLEPMQDPVVLCGTGQVYEYQSLKQWFQRGRRICPRTNIPVTDIQIIRIPAFKEQMHSWLRTQGLELEVQPPISTIPFNLNLKTPLGDAMDLQTAVRELKCGTSFRRDLSAAVLNDLLVNWNAQPDVQKLEDKDTCYQALKDTILDDMVWLVRYGSPYAQGVATSVLTFYAASLEEQQWVAATSVVPVTGLLFSQNKYAQQAAARYLRNVCYISHTIAEAVKNAGGLRGLLLQISKDPKEFEYSRAFAAAALWSLAGFDCCKKEIFNLEGEATLKELVLSPKASRYEQRDAAGALLKLKVNEASLKPELTKAKLKDLRYCSRAWVQGQVDDPQGGLQPDEIRHRRNPNQQPVQVGEQNVWVMPLDDSEGDAQEVIQNHQDLQEQG